MSDTPRTDDLLFSIKATPPYTKDEDTDRDRALYLCRTLERELNEANRKINNMHAVLDKLAAERDQLKRGEFICLKCGLRKDSDHAKGDF